jgi:hypothetical protein
MKQTIYQQPAAMKRFILSVLFCLALAGAATAAQSIYINYGTVVNPQVDATNFDNEGTFEAAVGSYDPSDLPYQFSDTINFTNHNVMMGDPGFDFETLPAGTGQAREAANFVNGNPVPFIFTPNAIVYGTGIVEIHATNLVNRGMLQTTDQGLLRVHGGTVDLSGSGFMVDAFGTGDTFFQTNDTDGIISGYWGNTNLTTDELTNTLTTVIAKSQVLVGTNYVATNIPFLYYVPVDFTPNFAQSLPVDDISMDVTRGYIAHTPNVLTFSNPPPFISAQWTGAVINAATQLPTNWMAQVLFINTNHNGTNITTSFANYGFSTITPSFGKIVVSWTTPATNAFGQIYTNSLYLEDTLATNPTNNTLYASTNLLPGQLTPQQTGLGGLPGLPTFQPSNYIISRFPLPLGGGVPVPPTPFTTNYVLSGTNNPVTNFVLSTYGPRLTSTNVTPFLGPYQSITDAPGRVEIVADGTLNLNNTRIDAVGYVLLRTTHVVAFTNASIGAAYSDFYLGSTNGTLTVANLTLPTISRLVGTVDAYSMFWSNMIYLPYSVPAVPLVDTNTFQPTNAYNGFYNVVMIDSHLTNVISTAVENLVLTCTNAPTNNVFVGTANTLVPDIYNIQQGFAFNTPNLTIEPSAQLNLLMGTPPDWEAQSPSLQSLTNLGVISCLGGYGLFFMQDSPGFSGTPYPPYPPYTNFVNAGSISAPGIVVAANYCQNSGILTAGSGAVEIDAQTAQLTGGRIAAATSDINIGCSNLLATNLVLTIGRSLSLSISNSVQAGANSWTVNDGFNLLASPASGDMRAVAVTDVADTNATVLNYWAAPDLGPGGFAANNSCVLGHLVLNGSPNSFFYFIGQNSQCGANPGVSNALYVDRLDLNNSAALTNASGLANVFICSGMKIYFNTVYLNGTLSTNVLNGKNGGALVKATDSTPGFTVSPGGGGVSPASIDLNVALAVTPGTTPAVGGSVGNPASAAVITWNTAPNATNYLYFKNSLSDTNWQVLTNFVSGPQGGTVSVSDPANVGGRFYQVRLDVPQ